MTDTKNTSTKFDVALSFAGEQRIFAEELREALKQRGLTVFYDTDFTADLWGENLIDYLSRVYGEESKYVIIIVSHDYVRKQFTNHERQTAQARALQNKGESYVLPIQFHADARLPGMPSTVSYLPADFGATKIAEVFMRKFANRESPSGSNTVPAAPPDSSPHNAAHQAMFPSLEEKASEVFRLIGSKMVSDENLYLFSGIGEDFIKDLVEASPDERAGIVEELVEEGYLSGEQFLSGERQWASFTVRPYGYIKYARAFVPGFDGVEQICMKEIVDQGSASSHALAKKAGISHLDVRQIFLYLHDMGLSTAQALSSDEVSAFSPSWQLKKLVKRA